MRSTLDGNIYAPATLSVPRRREAISGGALVAGRVGRDENADRMLVGRGVEGPLDLLALLGRRRARGRPLLSFMLQKSVCATSEIVS